MGTKLATGYDQPALGGVYKLTALKDAEGAWRPKVKLSEQAIKTTIPGILQVRRFETRDGMVGDMIYDEIAGPDARHIIVDATDPTRRKRMPRDAQATDLLAPVVRCGKIVSEPESLDVIRDRAQSQLARLHPAICRFLNPHEYPVGMDIGLHEARDRMIQDLRRISAVAGTPLVKIGMG